MTDDEARPPERHYRTLLANERTFLGWQGMPLSLLVASIALQSYSAPTTSMVYGVLAIILAGLGVAAAGHGLFRWRQVDRAIRGELPSPSGRTEKHVSFCDGKAITPI